MKKKMSILLVIALLTMAVLGGCGSDGTEASSGEKSSVVVGIQQDIDSLDPHEATAAGTKEILFNIFEGLVKTDANGNLMNAVASDYTISDDGLVYTFTLREGIKFHNGNPVTVEDVKYSLERVSGLLDGTALLSTLSAEKGGIQSVETPDDKTVRVTVGKANLELIYSFTTAIIPAGSGEDEAGTPIGTGPFAFVSYTPQEGIVLEKNADYWQQGLPILDKVTFKIVASGDTAMMELQSGSIDIYPYLTDSQANELKSSCQVLAAPSNVVQALFLNNGDETLSDVKVRQAILYALDKDEVNDYVFGGNSAVISSAMLPSLKDFYVDLNETYGTASNVEKAKELLAEAGYPDGIVQEIKVPSNYEVHVQTAEVVAEQLKAAGINVTITHVEWATWLDECYNGRQYQATISGITCDQTPGYLLNRFVSDSSKNFINYNNPEYDAVYAQALASLDLQEKAGFYKQLQTMLVEDAGTAFIQVPPITIAMNNELEGYQFYPIYVQDMSTVYFK